jgi:hypothetical protein
MFDKTRERKPHCRHICGYKRDKRYKHNINEKSIRVNNFHKVSVIIQNYHRCESNLTYLLYDYRAVTFKEETFYANTPSSPIAEHHWPTCTWHRNSRDFSPRKLTKSQRLHESNRTVKNKRPTGALQACNMLSILLSSAYQGEISFTHLIYRVFQEE